MKKNAVTWKNKTGEHMKVVDQAQVGMVELMNSIIKANINDELFEILAVGLIEEKKKSTHTIWL